MFAMVIIASWLAFAPVAACAVMGLVSIERLFADPVAEFTAADKASLNGAIHGGAL